VASHDTTAVFHDTTATLYDTTAALYDTTAAFHDQTATLAGCMAQARPIVWLLCAFGVLLGAARRRPATMRDPRPDTDDTAAALGFAKTIGKHLVVRSGGHQYCGLSSGGDDTILLSMDLFNHVEITAIGEKTHARVGVRTLRAPSAPPTCRRRAYGA
jgi:FAD binding domain